MNDRYKLGPRQIDAMVAMRDHVVSKMPRDTHGWTYTFTIGAHPERPGWGSIVEFDYAVIDTNEEPL